MKKNLLTFCCLLMFGSFGLMKQANAQCIVNNNLTGAGIFPDTLRYACLNSPYFDTVQFVFPSDTTIFGFTLPFDSFGVNQVDIPAILDWAQWECDRFMNNCSYVTTPGQETHGCVRIWGIPDSAGAPTDTIDIVGTAWVTIPGVGATPIQQTYRMGLWVKSPPNCIVGAAEELEKEIALGIYPNPVQHGSVMRFNLPTNSKVEIEAFDIFGRKVESLHSGKMAWGSQSVSLEKLLLQPPGIYLINFRLNEGQFTKTLKVNTLY